MQLGVMFKDTFFILGELDGSFWHPDYLTKQFSLFRNQWQLLNENGNPVKFHELRHTYASEMIAHGVDVKTVQNSLGHSSAVTTLNTYSTATQEAIKNASIKASEFLLQKSEGAQIYKLNKSVGE